MRTVHATRAIVIVLSLLITACVEEHERADEQASTAAALVPLKTWLDSDVWLGDFAEHASCVTLVVHADAARDSMLVYLVDPINGVVRRAATAPRAARDQRDALYAKIASEMLQLRAYWNLFGMWLPWTIAEVHLPVMPAGFDLEAWLVATASRLLGVGETGCAANRTHCIPGAGDTLPAMLPASHVSDGGELWPPGARDAAFAYMTASGGTPGTVDLFLVDATADAVVGWYRGTYAHIDMLVREAVSAQRTGSDGVVPAAGAAANKGVVVLQGPRDPVPTGPGPQPGGTDPRKAMAAQLRALARAARTGRP